MKNKTYFAASIFSFLLATYFLVNSVSGITGRVISEGVTPTTSGILAFVYAVAGVVLLLVNKGE